jgi:hypothetical protein
LRQKLSVSTARIHRKRHRGDVARLVRCQEQARVGDIDRFDPWDRQHVHRTGRIGELLAGHMLEVWSERASDMVVLDHRRVHVRRMHRVDPDVVRCKLVGQAAHQPYEPVFGGGVMRNTYQAAQAGDGTDQDHRPGCTLDQMRSCDSARSPNTGQVDVQHGLRGVLIHVGGHLPRRDTGRRAHHVEPAETGDTSIGRGLQTSEVTNIHNLRDDLTAGPADESRSLVEIVRCGGRHDDGVHRPADVEGDDVSALLRETHCLRPADSSRSTGDQSDLAS